MKNAEIISETNDATSAERQSLRMVLQSQLFQRAPNLSRILEYICERHFDGTADGIKEYSIAVEALGRSASFDPQLDAIVRVDLHLLRKRLDVYYAQEGRDDEMRITLRTGSYVPEFLRAGGFDPSEIDLCSVEIEPSSAGLASLSGASTMPERRKTPRSTRLTLAAETTEPARPVSKAWLMWIVCAGFGLVGILAGFLVTLAWVARDKPGIVLTNNLPEPVKTVAATFLQKLDIGSSPDSLLEGIRIRCGIGGDYVDSAGLHWQGDNYFSGGSTFSRPVSNIQRSSDSALYGTGRQGVFQYDIPVSPGAYEVHLLFAETQPGIEDAMRQVFYTVGLGQADSIDIASDAGGQNIATERVYANVHPGENGKIHLNFWSMNSTLNAIEVLPEPNGKPQPVRVSALHTLYQDISGGHWLPDRFFRGGSNVEHVFVQNRPVAPLFSREHYGNFDYAIPVAKGYKYQLTLYMAEHYWGVQNSGQGGIGSRIFTVRCNGLNLLTNFDLLVTQKNSDLVAVRFRDLEPDQTGELHLQFVPEVNFPLVNAFEVDAE